MRLCQNTSRQLRHRRLLSTPLVRRPHSRQPPTPTRHHCMWGNKTFLTNNQAGRGGEKAVGSGAHSYPLQSMRAQSV